MQRFKCPCGGEVFFDNTRCGQCGTAIVFDPVQSRFLDQRQLGDGAICRNYADYNVCNWVAAPGASHCHACSRNSVIPSLNSQRNIMLWSRMEAAKRRLLYGLARLSLPVAPVTGHQGLNFRFMEDQRTDPDVIEDFIATGHVAGTVTVNLAEADDAVRAERRQQMNERYRTLLGHLRHESGHYYFTVLLEPSQDALVEFRTLFGDERQDYEQALSRYYSSSPDLADWGATHVSRYAYAHPHEDWAETWAHYLHIQDALETADAWGVVGDGGEDWLGRWMSISIVINALNRSLGTDDAYPFVISPVIAAKLAFIDRQVARFGTPASA